MSTLTLHQDFSLDFTSIPNTFFDLYMPRANGEFVKIYLYIVRCLSHKDKSLSIDTLADTFSHTEADIMRALRYWNNEGLLEFIYSDNGRELTGLRLTYPTEPSGSLPGAPGASGTERISPDGKPAADGQPSSLESHSYVPKKTNFTAAQIRQLSEQDELQELNYLAERYLNRLLTPKDREVLLYLYVDLQFTVDLIVHLIEYCVSNNHASIRYIEKVALDWHAAGIHTIKEAKEHVLAYSNRSLSVMKAFGITGRSLGKSEQDFIVKWNEDYCFTDEMIIEACNRTLQNTHEPNFRYADSILNAWREQNILTLKDLEKADMEFSAARATSRNQTAKAGRSNTQAYAKHSYDMDQLEKMFLNNQ